MPSKGTPNRRPWRLRSRRFEVLLPLQFNDGRDVPPEWLADAVLEVVEQVFAAVRLLHALVELAMWMVASSSQAWRFAFWPRCCGSGVDFLMEAWWLGRD